MAISNNTDGFGVKINCDGGSIEHRQNFTDSYPSPHNANDVLVENIEPVDNGSVHYVLFLPLVREIGILELKYSSLTEQWVVEFIELEGINKPCQILFIVRIVNAHYTVCIYPTDDSNKLEVHEIFFNKTAPQESYINTLNFVNNFGSFDDFTNVVYADRGSTDDDLYIIRDNLISRINPLQHDQTPNEYQLSFDECVNLTCTSLYYIQPKHLLVHCLCCNQTGHCIRHGIRYDTYREDSSIIRMIEGVPYNCPDFKTSVIFRPSTQQISIEHDDSMTPLQLEGDGFREGLCSGNSSNVWFAYQDNTGHVFALDISNSDNLTLHTVAERSCLQGPNCRPISNISDLLIIQEFDDTTQQVFVKGINIYDNYSILFEVTSSQPNFFALVHVPSIIVPLTPSSTYKPHTAVTSLQPSSTTTEKPSHSSSNDILISAVVVAAVVIVIITAILISIIVLLWRKRYVYIIVLWLLSLMYLHFIFSGRIKWSIPCHKQNHTRPRN